MVRPVGELRIRDRVFLVTEATLMGYITTGADDRWECRWHLDIETESKVFASESFDGQEHWEPHAYAYHLRLPVRSWKEIEAVTVEGEDEQGSGLSVTRGETAFRLYVFEHAPITHNCLRFTARTGDVFDVDWTGIAAVYAGDDYSEDIPFHTRCKARFTRVEMTLRTRVAEAPAPDVDAIFSSALEASHFRRTPTRFRADSNGVREWETSFEPVL